MAPVLPYKKEDAVQQQHNNSKMLIHSLHYTVGKIQEISEVVFPAFDLIVASPLFSMVNCERNKRGKVENPSSWIYFQQYIEKSLPTSPHLITAKYTIYKIIIKLIK